MTKPILKHSSSSPHHNHNHTLHSSVHFPPSPGLTRTFTTHCSSAYDRSPIVVDTNKCAMPERNHRTYNIDDDSNDTNYNRPSTSRCSSKYRDNIAHDYHPRALHARELADSLSSMNLHSAVEDEYDDEELQRAQRRRTGTYAAFSARPPPPISSLPSLVPDMSSESDESDGFSPSPSASFTSTRHPGKLAFLSLSSSVVDLDPFDTPTPRAISILSTSNLAFLPHATSPTSPNIAPEDPAIEKARRKQIRRDNRDSRVASSPYDDVDDGYARDSDMSSNLLLSMNFSSSRMKTPSPTSPTRSSPTSRVCSDEKGRERYRRYASTSMSFSSGDSGCLEGF